MELLGHTSQVIQFADGNRQLLNANYDAQFRLLGHALLFLDNGHVSAGLV